MAINDFISGVRSKIRVGDVAQNRANSEAVNQKLAGNINFLLDRFFYQEGFAFNGYFNPNTFDDGVGGIRRIENDSVISGYYMSIRYNGTSGNNGVNVAVFNSAGGSVGNLFGGGGSAILIEGDNKNNILVGRKDLDTGAPSVYNFNTAGTTIQYGSLSITTLLAGYVLVPFITTNAVRARNLYFNLKLKEI